MKKMAWLVVVLVAGITQGGPVDRAREWVLANGAEGAEARFASCGITNGADQAAILAEWDEDVLVGVALRCKAYMFLSGRIGLEGLAPANRERIKAALAAEERAPWNTVRFVGLFGAGERGGFKRLLEAYYRERYAQQPETLRFYLRYGVDQALSFNLPGIEVADLVRLLLAPEPMGLKESERAKQAIKDRAVKLARVKLREEGGSFVVVDGVNPMVERVAPVVQALNAPVCTGLEGALRGLGVDVADAGRGALLELAAGWREEMLLGEMSGSDMAALLGKLAVVLGPDGFNAFVDEYNHGKAPTP
jgi:hypothetical protein